MNNWLNLSEGSLMLIISVYTDKFFISKKKKWQPIHPWTKDHRNHYDPFIFWGLVASVFLCICELSLQLGSFSTSLHIIKSLFVAYSQGILIHSGAGPAAEGRGGVNSYLGWQEPINLGVTQSGGP